MRIAVVGTGISGLVVAHHLHRRHDLTLFEAEAWIGGHAHTVDVELDGERHAIDTGFIVYNEVTYPGFCALLSELGVRSRATEMSFSVRDDRSGLTYASRGWNAIFAQRRNLVRPAFWRMLGEIPRFNRAARALIEIADEKTTLGDWLAGAEFTRELVDYYVVPLGAAIWSAPPGVFRRFPAGTFVRFLDNHGLLDPSRRIPWRVLEAGSQSYVDALVAPFRDRIRLRCPVRRVWREANDVQVATSHGVERFDRVVLACHSDQARALLCDPRPEERQALAAIDYQANDVLLHTDPRVMPRQRRAWANWNYRVPEMHGRPVSITYHMNRLQGLRARNEFFVTLNDQGDVDPARVLTRYVYHHPVYTPETGAAQKLHGRIDGADRVHFCGAYWRHGFHEDGVQSALAVVRNLARGS